MEHRGRGAFVRRGAGWLAALLLAFVLAACSSKGDDDSAGAQSDAAARAASRSAEAASESLALPAADVQFSQNVVAGDGANGGQANANPSEAEAAGPESGAAQGSVAAAATGTSTAQGDDAAGGTSGGIGAIADPSGGYNRKMIYSANVVMQAESFAKAEEKVSNAIFQSQGFIVQFADTHNGDEIGSTYVIKVPSANFSSFLALLKAIPNKSFDRQVQGNDVTEEYVDLQARLAAKQAVETRLLAFMDKATKSDDLVKFSNELGSVQQEIEQIKGRMRYLDQNVAYSTVNLRLYESAAEAAPNASGGRKLLGEKLSDALLGSARVLGSIGEGLLTFAAGLLPVLAVAAAIGLPAWWWTRKSRAARKIRAAARRMQLNAAAPAPAGPPASQAASAPDEGGDAPG